MSVIETEKQKQIIETAKKLFWKYGMKRVSVEEVCREAHVSKMTFYHYYQNKNDLAMAILDLIQEEGMKKYQDIMDRDVSFAEKVRLWVQLKMEQTKDLSSEFFNDLHKNAPPEVTAHFQKIYTESVQRILDDFLQARQRGDIRKDIKPEFILYFLNRMIDMTDDENLSTLYDSPQEMILELTNFFFYGILPRREKNDG
ncbi:TetR/AcrR family transcriptional regulator [bacterium]|nr:TetR/AcrR family transcriptional regulator [bacterium]RQV94291.1 MAG: TetR/AcrR family transcriptional regulator [bacterium]